MFLKNLPNEFVTRPLFGEFQPDIVRQLMIEDPTASQKEGKEHLDSKSKNQLVRNNTFHGMGKVNRTLCAKQIKIQDNSLEILSLEANIPFTAKNNARTVSFSWADKCFHGCNLGMHPALSIMLIQWPILQSKIG